MAVNVLLIEDEPFIADTVSYVLTRSANSSWCTIPSGRSMVNPPPPARVRPPVRDQISDQ